MFGKNKNLILMVLGGSLIFAGYYFFLKPEPQESLTTTTSVSESAVTEQNIIRTLNRLSNIDLDASILESQIYDSLIERELRMTREPEGKENIFTPYERDFIGGELE